MLLKLLNVTLILINELSGGISKKNVEQNYLLMKALSLSLH